MFESLSYIDLWRNSIHASNVTILRHILNLQHLADITKN